MSDARFSNRPAEPEDDWFAESDGGRPSTDPAESRPQGGYTLDLDPARGSPGTERPAERRRRTGLLGLATAVAAVVVFVCGVLAAGAFTPSEDTETTTVTTTATTTVTTQTAPADTSPTTTTPTTPTTPTTLPTGVVLRPGDENENVRAVQAALIELGYSTGGADGKFGPATVEAVLQFQTASGLEADGSVGPATLAALRSALDES